MAGGSWRSFGARRSPTPTRSMRSRLALATRGVAVRCDFASARRVELSHAIRRRQAVLAGALVAASWQSPSIRHARCSQAGPADGRVTAHHDDYARDRHPAGVAYERALAATRSPGCVALLTSCGMSAVVVVLAHLERDGALRDGVLMGASTYHETRDLVRRASPGALCLAEHPDEAFAAAIARLRPACVVIDAVATEAGVAVPDVAGIARRLAAARPGAWLVVDVTGAPLAMDLFALPEVQSGRLRVLAIESLTKHAQLGLDRVTAGAIYASNGDAAALDVLREHLGANIADASVHALPTPTAPCWRGGSRAMRATPARSPGAWPSGGSAGRRRIRTPAAGDVADAPPRDTRARRGVRGCGARARSGARHRARGRRQLRAGHDSRLCALAGRGRVMRIRAHQRGHRARRGTRAAHPGRSCARCARHELRTLQACRRPRPSKRSYATRWTRCPAGSRPTSRASACRSTSGRRRARRDVYAFFDGPALGDDPVGQLPPVITLFRRPLRRRLRARPGGAAARGADHRRARARASLRVRRGAPRRARLRLRISPRRCACG